ncbi:T9SS type A sorting domain-containing protein [uncultured Psychroserpens sp.]|uniref:T9SS type A sorting domain-containing protein n=1 Tax=uncultured Psychroserpens sp. TaxID=255436 RepID=UPI002635AA5C|nr:T9SS type A sorting domain-containing protein [uncultured Psychroserpens sp.]
MKINALSINRISTFIIILIMYSSNCNAQLNILDIGFILTDVSDDGTIAVGHNNAEHFIWTEANGVNLIGGVEPSFYGGQTRINGDGTIIAGTRINPSNSLGELSSYDVDTQAWTSYGSLGFSSQGSASSAWGISSDGSTIVGLGWFSSGSAHAIKWTADGGLQDLGSTIPGQSTRANAVNNDGSVIGGWQDNSDGIRQGAIWTNGVQTLLTHSNNNPAAEVGTLSDDGLWAGGGGQSPTNEFQAWKWSQSSGIINIGPSPVSGWRGTTTGLSSDGEITVGYYRQWPGPAAFGRGFIHTESEGLVDLTDYAISVGIDVQGAILALPLGLSDDGSTVVGVTNNGRGFIFRLPLLGVEDNVFDDFSLYPNPAKDILNFQIPEHLNIDRVSIFSAIGQKVNDYDTLQSINVSSLSTGLYFVRIQSGKTVWIKRFSKL